MGIGFKERSQLKSVKNLRVLNIEKIIWKYLKYIQTGYSTILHSWKISNGQDELHLAAAQGAVPKCSTAASQQHPGERQGIRKMWEEKNHL